MSEREAGPRAAVAGSPAPASGWRTRLAAAALLALGYWAAAWLGLHLAIPPSYATPVWPASGIALGGLLLLGAPALPAIGLGAFAANLVHALGASVTPGPLPHALALAALLAVIPPLQALLGAALIRHSAGFPPAPGREREVLLALLLCAPLSSALSGLLAPLLLCSAGVIPAAELAFRCWTWWLGDSMGALIFTPLVLVFAPGAARSAGWRRQRTAVALPLLAAFALSIALFHQLNRVEQQRRSERFTARAQTLAHRLESELSGQLRLLQSLASLYAASNNIERAEFRVYSQHLLETYTGLRAIVWAPRVSEAERPTYEAAVRSEGFSDFAIREPGANEALVLAGEREEYFPIHFAEPAPRNRPVLGFDLASEPRRASALSRARATHRAMASAPLELLRGAGERRGLMVALPVYRTSALPGGGEELQGFAVVAFALAELVEALGLAPDLAELGVHVYDGNAAAGEQLLFGAPAPQRADPLDWQSELSMGGRRWTIAFHATPAYLAQQRSWASWLVLAGVLVLSATLGLLSVLLHLRRSRIELLVAERTAELARSNAELEQFAYVASHDLQDPLKRISHCTARLTERCAGQLDPDAEEWLRGAAESAQRMRALIQDLLHYARAGSTRLELVPCELERACSWALDNLAMAIEESGARIERDALPRVLGDERQLGQLLQNLIGNALKFRGDAPPLVEIRARRAGERWQIAVRDNGIGIDPDYQELIFVLFQRLHEGPRYPGTGLGLALCKKIAERHGSELCVESSPGKGASFSFTLAATPELRPPRAAQTRSSPT